MYFAIPKQELKVKNSVICGMLWDYMHKISYTSMHAQSSVLCTVCDKSTKTDIIVTLRPGSDAELFMSRT